MDYERLMHLAIEQAKKAEIDIPVGALVVSKSGEVISTGHNQKELKNDPTSHAEIEAIRAACNRLGGWRLDDYALVVTLEPCVMCAGAISASRLGILVFGAFNPRAGAVGSNWDMVRDPRLSQKTEVISGVLARECSSLLTTFKFRDECV